MITFRPLTHDDLPMLREWIARPHVAEWWGEQATLAELAEHYAPVIAGTSHQKCYIAFADDTPIGFIQSYVPAADHSDGWWLDVDDPGVREGRLPRDPGDRYAGRASAAHVSGSYGS